MNRVVVYLCAVGLALLLVAVAYLVGLRVNSDWQFTDQQFGLLKAELRETTPTTKPILISVTPGAGLQAFDLAYHLMWAFTGAGWPAAVTTDYDAEYPPITTGLLVSVKVGHIINDMSDFRDPAVVMAMLKHAGLKPRYSEDHGMKEGDVKIVVGYRP